MLNDLESLPDDPAKLREIVSVLAGELKSRDILIEKLKHQLAAITANGSAPSLRAWINCT